MKLGEGEKKKETDTQEKSGVLLYCAVTEGKV